MSVEMASSRAYRFIKDMIFRYQLVPGQKVTYEELANKLKMSKTPIINALSRLEQEEFLVSIPNRGFFVKEIDIEEVSELFKIREALELLSVEEAVRNMNPKKLKELEKAMIVHQKTDFRTPTSTRYRWGLDVAFHLKIAEMSGNKNLVAILKHVCELNYLRHRTEGVSIKRLSETAEEHRRIFTSIIGKNLAEAKAEMRKHLAAGKMSTIQGIQALKAEFSIP